MTPQQIIRMAREAGFIINDDNPVTWSLERFAALVAAREREACAKVCDEIYHYYACDESAGECVKAIRARGQ